METASEKAQARALAQMPEQDSLKQLESMRDMCITDIGRFETLVAVLRERHSALTLLIEQCLATPAILEFFEKFDNLPNPGRM